MKILIAILSCWACELNGDNQSVRDTWLRDLQPSVDSKFFCGSGYSCFPGSDKKVCQDDVSVHHDTFVLKTPEAYEYLIPRSQELYKLAYRLGYDFVFKCYPDTYVDFHMLIRSGFEKHDYFGHWLTAPGASIHKYGCLGGGEGYWLSRKALEIISKATPDPEPIGEDTWVGAALGAAGVSMIDHTGYGSGITLHGSVEDRPVDYRPGQYRNQWMRDTYKRLKG
jgi:hypothetical protein